MTSCSDCIHKRTRNDLEYCEAKHIDCSVRNPDSPCSKYDRDDEDETRLYGVNISAHGYIRVVARSREDAEEYARVHLDDVDWSYEIDDAEELGRPTG